MAFIPMCYLYGKKFVGPITELVLSLREELHTHPYEKINWKQARRLCAKVSPLTVYHLTFCSKYNIFSGSASILHDFR